MSTAVETRRAGVVRVLLVLLAVTQGVVGVWALGAPRAFFDGFPLAGHGWVGLLPPYNEHLVRDAGASFLALTVALGLAAWWLDRRVVILATVTFLTFAVPHAAFHFAHLERFSVVDAVAQQGGLVAQIVLAVVVLVLAARSRAPEWRA